MSFDASFVVTCCTRFNACGPVTNTSPICDTSNRPHDVRTAVCSATMPGLYWTGIIKPANGISFAPACSCSPNSGVFFITSISNLGDVAQQARHDGLLHV